jgi:hypothetical protein
MLSAKGLRLHHSSVLSFDPSVSVAGPRLPRLAQLRLGAQLREALLTDLPAHEAVRAMAAEPFQHPLLALMPWAFCIAALGTVLAGVFTSMLAVNDSPAFGVMLIVLALIAITWFAAGYLLDTRPRRFLLLMANRLESGEEELTDLLPLLPSELREVMRSQTNDECRARAVSELVPTLIGTRLHNHRFALSFFGPLLLMSVVFLGLYAVMIFIVPGFVTIFSDFGAEMPSVTMVIANLSRMLQSGGTAAFWFVCALVATGLVVTYILILNQQIAQFLSTIPVLGVPFRWLMQARVARVLGAMIRNGSSGTEALRTATAASGFDTVRAEGERIAAAAKKGSANGASPHHLSALPISLLIVDPARSGEQNEERARSVAQSLTSFANMLEQASEGHGRLIGLIVQCAVIVIGGFMIGMIVLALFLPLIKLMNDLA